MNPAIWFLVFSNVSWLGPMKADECLKLRDMAPSSALCRMAVAYTACSNGGVSTGVACPVFDGVATGGR